MQGGDEQPQNQPGAQAGDQFLPGGSAPQPVVEPPAQTGAATVSGNGISWEGPEYIHRQKGAGWYLGFIVLAVLIVSTLYIFFRDVFVTIVLVLMSVAVLVSASRKPKVRNYTLGSDMITVGNKQYRISDFRSFTLVEDPEADSVSLWPTKRFTPPLAVYFSHADSERIVNHLGAHLPYEEHQPDFMDRLLERIRF